MLQDHIHIHKTHMISLELGASTVFVLVLPLDTKRVFRFPCRQIVSRYVGVGGKNAEALQQQELVTARNSLIRYPT